MGMKPKEFGCILVCNYSDVRSAVNWFTRIIAIAM